MTPEERLNSIVQELGAGGSLSNLDPGSLALIQLYYLMADGITRIANHLEGTTP